MLNAPKRKCGRCKKLKPLGKYKIRHDRPTYFSWCSDCMNREGRSTDYPKIEHRGSGNANPDKDWQIGP